MTDGMQANRDAGSLSVMEQVGRMCEQFEDAWIVAKLKEPGLSYPADKPVKRIDYIFTRRSDRLRVKRPKIVTTLASDHLPVVADIQIR